MPGSPRQEPNACFPVALNRTPALRRSGSPDILRGLRSTSDLSSASLLDWGTSEEAEKWLDGVMTEFCDKTYEVAAHDARREDSERIDSGFQGFDIGVLASMAKNSDHTKEYTFSLEGVEDDNGVRPCCTTSTRCLMDADSGNSLLRFTEGVTSRSVADVLAVSSLTCNICAKPLAQHRASYLRKGRRVLLSFVDSQTASVGSQLEKLGVGRLQCGSCKRTWPLSELRPWGMSALAFLDFLWTVKFILPCTHSFVQGTWCHGNAMFTIVPDWCAGNVPASPGTSSWRNMFFGRPTSKTIGSSPTGSAQTNLMEKRSSGELLKTCSENAAQSSNADQAGRRRTSTSDSEDELGPPLGSADDAAKWLESALAEYISKSYDDDAKTLGVDDEAPPPNAASCCHDVDIGVLENEDKHKPHIMRYTFSLECESECCTTSVRCLMENSSNFLRRSTVGEVIAASALSCNCCSLPLSQHRASYQSGERRVLICFDRLLWDGLEHQQLESAESPARLQCELCECAWTLPERQPRDISVLSFLDFLWSAHSSLPCRHAFEGGVWHLGAATISIEKDTDSVKKNVFFVYCRILYGT